MKREFLFHRIEDPMKQSANYPSGAGSTSLPELEKLVGSQIMDFNSEDVGRVHCLWKDESNQASFIGVKTGWLGMGAIHIIPAEFVQYSQRFNRLRVPFTKDQIKDAPSYEADEEVDAARQEEVYAYYNRLPNTGFGRETRETRETSTSAQPPYTQERREAGNIREEARIPLHEEQLKVGKRQVESGGVRLRKIIRVETVQQPVELKHEELVVEKVPASGSTPSGEAFQGEEIFIPLRTEEAVVEKETRVREEMRVRKEARVETGTVSGELRKEEIESDKEGKVIEREHEHSV